MRRRALLALGVLAAACAAPSALPASPATVSAKDPFKLTSNIKYMKALGKKGENLLDVYAPRKLPDHKLPVLFWIHSGGWYQGNKTDEARAKAIKFVRSGFVFVAVNYRLSPKPTNRYSFDSDRVMFPDYVKDAAKGLGWVNRNIRDYGGNPKKIVLSGHSAGGQIAALLATDPIYILEEKLYPDQIKGVISLDSVALDLSAEANPKNSGEVARYHRMYWNAFGTPAENRQQNRWKAATPMDHADPSDPPFLFIASREAPWRERDAARMARSIGRSAGFSVIRVAMSHKRINHTFGRDSDTSRQTTVGLKFARSVVSDDRSKPLIRGGSRFSLPSGSSEVVRFRVGSSPSSVVLRCRLDDATPEFCSGPESYRVGRGSHVLKVTSYDYMKGRRRVAVHRFRVSG
ncbi:MAG: alpha/beta hydrolase [Solirubrobacterales bacterium]|nr:alpha/beta hydrolase [Solirubrobacterales bacterium]